jgi:DNA-directed RNA polymerase specialized sigma24 family protein
MTKETQDAIERLQRLSLSASGKTNASAARYDDALDRLLRHPDAHGDPRELARQAERHARQHLARRSVAQKIVLGLQRRDVGISITEKTHPIVTGWPPARWSYDDTAALLVLDAISHLALDRRERMVIGMIIADCDIEQIANALGVTVGTAHVVVHRTRRRAYALYRKA